MTSMKHAIKLVLQRALGLDRYLFWFGVFRVYVARLDRRERGLFKFIELLPEHSIVLDVGANIGVTGTLIKRSVPSVGLYAFEPIPSNLDTLRRVYRLFRVEAQIVPLAVGDRTGEVEMVLPADRGVVLHGLGHVRHPSVEGHTEGSVMAVKLVSLDESRSLWNERRVAGIKIDVENFEYFVLSGARHTLENDRPIVYCELWDNANRRKSIDLMASLGYSVQMFDGDRLIGFDAKLHKEEDNFFFTPTERFATGT